MLPQHAAGVSIDIAKKHSLMAGSSQAFFHPAYPGKQTDDSQTSPLRARASPTRT